MTIKRLTALVLALLLLTGSCLAEQPAQRWGIGGFKADNLQGKPVDQTVLKDAKLTMLNVWATYCTPCLAEMPDLGQLAADYKEKGVQIIGLVSDAMAVENNTIVADPEMTAKAIKLVEETQADYLHLLPSMDLYASLLWQVEAVPMTIFLDSEGYQVGYAYTGSRSYDDWAAILDETLALLPEEAPNP